MGSALRIAIADSSFVWAKRVAPAFAPRQECDYSSPVLNNYKKSGPRQCRVRISASWYLEMAEAAGVSVIYRNVLQ